MNYRVHYDKLIERAKERKLNYYVESHHIIPRCMRGTDDKSNLVNLTAREHFIAHVLLVKVYPNEYGLIKAVSMMCVSGRKQNRVGNRMYGWLREKFSEEISRSQTGKGNSQYGTMWVCNINTNESKKVSTLCDIEEGWVKGRGVTKDKYTKLLAKEAHNSEILSCGLLETLGYPISRINYINIETFRKEVLLYDYLKQGHEPEGRKILCNKFLLSGEKVSKIVNILGVKYKERRGGSRVQILHPQPKTK